GLRQSIDRGDERDDVRLRGRLRTAAARGGLFRDGFLRGRGLGCGLATLAAEEPGEQSGDADGDDGSGNVHADLHADLLRGEISKRRDSAYGSALALLDADDLVEPLVTLERPVL